MRKIAYLMKVNDCIIMITKPMWYAENNKFIVVIHVHRHLCEYYKILWTYGISNPISC